MLLRLISFVVLAVVATRLCKLAYLMGYHKTIYNQYPGPCRVVPNVDKGAEDITVTSDGLAFISSGFTSPRYIHDPRHSPQSVKGRIFLFDFNNPDGNATEIPLVGNIDRDSFYPHGISLYEDPKTGERRLFVVNHLLNDEDTVELFRFDGKTKKLHHLKTFKGETMSSLNDVVAIGPESFYFSNDYYFKKTIPRQFELYAGLTMGSIGLYDVTDTIVVSGINSPNGINMSPDGKFVYLASPVQQAIFVYERDRKTNSLLQKKVIYVYSAVDNIEVDAKTGNLWLGCHPCLHMILTHFEDITKPAGSHVLLLQMGSPEAPYENVSIRQVFMDDGELISASTAARYYENKLLIGGVLDTLVYCEIKAF